MRSRFCSESGVSLRSTQAFGVILLRNLLQWDRPAPCLNLLGRPREPEAPPTQCNGLLRGLLKHPARHRPSLDTCGWLRPVRKPTLRLREQVFLLGIPPSYTRKSCYHIIMQVGRAVAWVLIGSISFALAYWQAFAGVSASSYLGDADGVIPVGQQVNLPLRDSFNKAIPQSDDLRMVLTSTCSSCSVDRLGLAELLEKKRGILIVWDGDATEIIAEHPNWKERHFLIHKGLALTIPSAIRKLSPGVAVVRRGAILRFAPANSPSVRALLQ